jgi:hypothetical protein
MRYSFIQNEQDLEDFYYYYSWANPEKRYLRIFSRVLAPIILAVWIGVPINQYNLPEIISIGLTLVAAVFFGPLVRWQTKQKTSKILRSGKNIDMIGQRTLEFTDGSFFATTPTSTAEIKWDAFEYLKETKNHFFLFQTVNMAIIIPKRIFQSTEEIIQVRIYLNSKVTASNKRNKDTVK